MPKVKKTAKNETAVEVAAPAPAEQAAILEQLDASFGLAKIDEGESGTALEQLSEVSPEKAAELMGVEAPVASKPKKSKKAKAAPVVTEELVEAPAQLAAAAIPEPVEAEKPQEPKPLPFTATVLGECSILGAIKVLSRPLPLCALPEGSYFYLDGRWGMYVEMSGSDAKVDLDGKHEAWSGMTEVYWMPTRLTLRGSSKPSNGKHTAPSTSTGGPSPTQGGKNPVQAKSSPKSAGPRASGQEIFGFAPTAILRWLGKAGVDKAAAVKVMAAKGIAVAEATVGIQVRAGTKGERGEPAPLTAEQGEELLALAK